MSLGTTEQEISMQPDSVSIAPAIGGSSEAVAAARQVLGHAPSLGAHVAAFQASRPGRGL